MVRFSLRPMGKMVTVPGARSQLEMLSSAVKVTGKPGNTVPNIRRPPN